jgi:hypothetical protein
MTDVDMKETMDRTREALARHLCDLMDEIEGNGGRITSRRLLGGIHETLESMSHLSAMPDGTMEKAK